MLLTSSAASTEPILLKQMLFLSRPVGVKAETRKISLFATFAYQSSSSPACKTRPHLRYMKSYSPVFCNKMHTAPSDQQLIVIPMNKDTNGSVVEAADCISLSSEATSNLTSNPSSSKSFRSTVDGCHTFDEEQNLTGVHDHATRWRL
jgi:hypothetical protein